MVLLTATKIRATKTDMYGTVNASYAVSLEPLAHRRNLASLSKTMHCVRVL